MVEENDGCRHLTMSPLGQKTGKRVNYVLRLPKNMKQSKQNVRGRN